MKVIFRDKLLLPGWIALAIAVFFSYWSYQFQQKGKDADADLIKVEQIVQQMDCSALNKKTIVQIKRDAVEDMKLVGTVSFWFSVILVGIFFTNIQVVYAHRKKRILDPV
jgi:hypothetical protein